MYKAEVKCDKAIETLSDYRRSVDDSIICIESYPSKFASGDLDCHRYSEHISYIDELQNFGKTEYELNRQRVY